MHLSDLEHLILCRLGQAMGDHGLLAEGDRVLVGLSGDGASQVLLSSLIHHRTRSGIHVELMPVQVEGASRNLPLGTLLDVARERGANRLALSDCLDDFLEELLHQVFFHGRLASLAICEPAEGGHGSLRIIRPLAYVERSLLEEAAPGPASAHKTGNFFEENTRQGLLSGFDDSHPGFRRYALAALKHVRETHLMDPGLLMRSQGPQKTS